VVYNGGTSTVLILDNDTTAMTAIRIIRPTGLTINKIPTSKLDIEALVRAIGVKNLRVVDPLKINRMKNKF
jgi:indolepyruvate ferredoxin oxidoreductase alpha subunit